MAVCQSDASHVYPDHNTECPWCALTVPARQTRLSPLIAPGSGLRLEPDGEVSFGALQPGAHATRVVTVQHMGARPATLHWNVEPGPFEHTGSEEVNDGTSTLARLTFEIVMTFDGTGDEDAALTVWADHKKDQAVKTRLVAHRPAPAAPVVSGHASRGVRAAPAASVSAQNASAGMPVWKKLLIGWILVTVIAPVLVVVGIVAWPAIRLIAELSWVILGPIGLAGVLAGIAIGVAAQRRRR